jgi:hypothetical protein
MYNQWVEVWSSLGTEDRGDGLVVGRVATQAVNRLGRKGDELPGPQQSGGAIKRVGRQPNCHGAVAFVLCGMVSV